ncbi:MAG: hypothetical protein KBB83_01640 [Alphaproteobacteria bacterium]|nr:hypothetical protein [Alphaproteobacteria bacterium]
MRKMDSFVNITFFCVALSSAQASWPQLDESAPSRVGMVEVAPDNTMQQLEEQGLLLKQQQETLKAECQKIQVSIAEKQRLFNALNPNNKKFKENESRLKQEIAGLEKNLAKKEEEITQSIQSCRDIAEQMKQMESGQKTDGWDNGRLNISLEGVPLTSASPSPASSMEKSKETKVMPLAVDSNPKGKEELSDEPKASADPIKAAVPRSEVAATKALAAIEEQARDPSRRNVTSVGWVETVSNAVVNNASYLYRALTAAPLFPVGSYPSLTLSDVLEKFKKEWGERYTEKELRALKRDFLFYQFPPLFINSSISTGKYFLPHGFYYGTVKIDLADVNLKLDLAKLSLEQPMQDKTKLEWYKALLKRTEDASQVSGYIVNFTDKTRTCGPYEFLERIISCVTDIREEAMFVNFQNSRRPSGNESTKTLLEMDFLAWDEKEKTAIFWGLCGLREDNKLKGPSDYEARQKKAKERRAIDWPILG